MFLRLEFSSLLLTIVHVRSFPQLFGNPWLLLLISNWNLKSLLEALSVLTLISLWNDRSGLFGQPLMSLGLELYFLAAESAHNRIHMNYPEDPGLAARALGIK